MVTMIKGEDKPMGQKQKVKGVTIVGEIFRKTPTLQKPKKEKAEKGALRTPRDGGNVRETGTSIPAGVW